MTNPRRNIRPTAPSNKHQQSVTKFIQINLHHCKLASAELNRRQCNGDFHIGLIQEPWIKGNKIQGITNQFNKVIYNTNSKTPRAAIVVDRNTKFLPIPDIINDDCAAITTTFNEGGSIKEVIVASIYFPGDQQIPDDNLKKLLKFADKKKTGTWQCRDTVGRATSYCWEG